MSEAYREPAKACFESSTQDHIHVYEFIETNKMQEDESYTYYETRTRCYICKEEQTIDYRAHKGI